MVSKKSLNFRIPIITGTTSSGKTSFAIDFCKVHPKFKIEIINADSLGFYRGFDIGSAKPSREQQLLVPHHLIDISNPNEQFSASDYLNLIDEKITEIASKGAVPLIVGGSGFYLKVLTHGLWKDAKTDQEFRKTLEAKETEVLYESLNGQYSSLGLAMSDRVNPGDRYRIIRWLEVIHAAGFPPEVLEKRGDLTHSKYEYQLFCVDREREELVRRIQTRTKNLIRDGIVDETKKLFELFPDSLALRSVGYRETLNYLKGILPQGRKIPAGIVGLEEEINLSTRQLVKKQRTWFRGQREMEWFILDKDRPRLWKCLEDLYEKI